MANTAKLFLNGRSQAAPNCTSLRIALEKIPQ
jgi:hypothetical protein